MQIKKKRNKKQTASYCLYCYLTSYIDYHFIIILKQLNIEDEV